MKLLYAVVSKDNFEVRSIIQWDNKQPKAPSVGEGFTAVLSRGAQVGMFWDPTTATFYERPAPEPEPEAEQEPVKKPKLDLRKLYPKEESAAAETTVNVG